MAYSKEELSYEKIMNDLVSMYPNKELSFDVQDKNGKGFIVINYNSERLYRFDYDESGLPENYRKGKEVLFKHAINTILLGGIAYARKIF